MTRSAPFNRPRGTLRRPISAMALGLIALVLAGCEASNDEEVVPPPIRVSSIALDSSENTIELDPTEPFSFGITFNRAVPPRTLFVRFYPEPVSTGAFTPNTSTRRSWTWHDIVIDPDVGAYHLLIDGLEMRWPVTYPYRTLFVDPLRLLDVGIGGLVDSPNRIQIEPEGTVVFALELGSGFLPGSPETWADAQSSIASVLAVTNAAGGVLGPLPYRLQYLQDGRFYRVVAIKDTNGDAKYDPMQDWWAPGLVSFEFVAVRAVELGGDDPLPTEAPDLDLGPPGPRVLVNRR